MNYQHIYNSLVKKAQNRLTVVGYTEKHHIIPRALGGSNDTVNIVVFTGREHFIAHLLLAKIHGGKMIHAVYMMSTRNGYTNRIYEKMRIEFGIRISNNTDRSAKISQALKGRAKTDAHKESYKQSKLAGDKWIVSEEHKQKISDSMSGAGNPMWGKTHTEESRKIISEANLQKLICPHCQKEGGISIMKRWHFDNCKQAPIPKARKNTQKRYAHIVGKKVAVPK